VNFKFFFTLLLVALINPVLFSGENRRCTVKILNSAKKTVIINAEIAETEGAKRTGLMFRRVLPENYGMLFVFNDERNRRFWMKNTYIPLSIAYISGKGVINEIYLMKPLDTSVTYPSKIPAKYALEVKQGWFTRNGVKPGSKVILNGCIGK
jgi:uncharacterized membrane protein (UPF0127 family)